MISCWVISITGNDIHIHSGVLRTHNAKPDDQAAKAAYKSACSTLKAELKASQNDWWTGPTQRTQRYADIGDMHAFYEALKAVYEPSH